MLRNEAVRAHAKAHGRGVSAAFAQAAPTPNDTARLARRTHALKLRLALIDGLTRVCVDACSKHTVKH